MSDPVTLDHPIPAQHRDALHDLNQAHAVELSSLTRAEFERLIAQAFFAASVEQGALMLTFDEAADYDSPNFLWFREKYDRFVYVDRIVVAESHRGRGIARVLYDALFVRARAAGHTRIVAEVNSDPPNPGSDAFHAQMGFETVGEARLADRGKSVRYIARSV